MSDSTPSESVSGALVPRLAGREREQAALRAWLDALLDGAGRVVLVGGEAGIGKTVLLQELTEEAAARGVLVAGGACYDLSVTPPYGPWSEVAGALDAADEGAADDAPGALSATLRQRLTEIAARRPLVVILDDLHWADSGSLDLLRQIARDIRRQRVLLVAGYRDDELGREHPLSELIPALVREAPSERLTLRPLERAAIQELVDERYTLAAPERSRLVSYLYEHTGGNPFYLLEVLRELEDEGLLRQVAARWTVGDLERALLPPLVRQVIERRLARLGAPARPVLEVGAVIGRDIPLDLWLSVAGTTRPELDDVIVPTIEARLLQPAGVGRLRFSHALFQEALYLGLSPLRRREVHRAVAETLAQGAYADPGTIAHHFRQAGDARAVDWLVRAALQADRDNASQAVVEYLETAATLLESVPDAGLRRSRLQYALIEHRHHSSAHESHGILDAVERAARPSGNRAFLAAIQHTRALLYCSAGSTERGIEEYRRLGNVWERLTLSERREVSLTIARPLLWLEQDANPIGETAEVLPDVGDILDAAAFHAPFVYAFSVYGRIVDALEIASDVVGQLEALPQGDESELIALARSTQWIEGYIGLGMAYALLGQVGTSRSAFAKARGSYRAAGLTLFEGVTAFTEIEFITVPYLIDVAQERAAAAGRAVDSWERASAALPTGESPRTPLFQMLVVVGEWEAAWQLAETARLYGHPGWRARVPSTLAQLAHLRGEAELAWSHISGTLPEGPETRPGRINWRAATALLRVAVELALDAGDLTGARAWLDAHDAWLAWSGAVFGRAHGHLLWAAYWRASGDVTAATRAAEEARELASAPRQPLALLGAWHLLGELAIVVGDYAPAERHLGEALAIAAACDAPWERARCLLALVELRLMHGDRAAAHSLLAEARAICLRLGAQPALARIATLEARCADLPLDERTSGLTVREEEVLRLIAAGRSNREIAAELAMSVRTAERHVANVYIKINAGSRAEAIAFAHRNGYI